MLKNIKWFTLSNEVCQACGGSGVITEYLDDDNEMESQETCSCCGGTGYED